jgi:hypothetical protein
VYVAGTFNNIGGLNRNGLAYIDRVSGTALTWNPNAAGSASTLMKSGEAVFAGGSFAAMNNLPHAGLAAMTLSAPVGVAAPDAPRTAGLWLACQPNPFQLSTRVRFMLPRASAVTLTVTDVAGREVARPLDGRTLVAGEHSVLFSPRALPAGVYLYTLRGDGFAETRKMVRVP